ncbi:ATP-binding cassette domain-containing protein [Paraburkholderia xenovorans]|uniref:ATP-binding cassette domain-containing protein n=1 Tax=Paraburkholderia xenovorans TaxID=36873 RepID=UPI0038BD47B8
MRIDYRIDRPVRLEASFEVEGFTVLLGQSGEGKTTLLRAIAGLLPAQGEPFGGLPPQHRAIGYLPQGYALFPHLCAWENVAFARVASTRSVRSLYFLSSKCGGCAHGITLTLRLQNARENRAGFRLPVRPFNQRHLSGIGRCPRQTYVASAHD